jgi:hypothetical protein
MARAIIVVFVFTLSITSCTQRMVCPAYQSAYIHDKDFVRKKFSYFVGDSTPKVLTASRNKYLVGETLPYKKRVRNLQTVAMRPVNPVVPDSLQAGFEKDISQVERNVFDSTAVIRIDTLATSVQDSTYMISKDREVRVLKYNTMKRNYYVDTVGFNTQQDNYMWYLREWLVLPDARIANRQAEAEETGKEKKGLFKNLFKKKKDKTEPTDIADDLVPAEQEDYGYDDFEGKVRDSTAVQQPVQTQPQTKPKKGSFLKRKKTEKKKKEEPPVKKEEDDDEGF